MKLKNPCALYVQGFFVSHLICFFVRNFIIFNWLKNSHAKTER